MTHLDWNEILIIQLKSPSIKSDLNSYNNATGVKRELGQVKTNVPR